MDVYWSPFWQELVGVSYNRVLANWCCNRREPVETQTIRLANIRPLTKDKLQAKILVHLTHGPEHPTRAALAILMAKVAIEEVHPATLFLARDAVQWMRDGVLDSFRGLGPAKLRESNHNVFILARR